MDDAGLVGYSQASLPWLRLRWPDDRRACETGSRPPRAPLPPIGRRSLLPVEIEGRAQVQVGHQGNDDRPAHGSILLRDGDGAGGLDQRPVTALSCVPEAPSRRFESVRLAQAGERLDAV